jgi:hypothetical protein
MESPVSLNGDLIKDSYPVLHNLGEPLGAAMAICTALHVKPHVLREVFEMVRSICER